MTSPTTYKLGFPKLKYSVVPMASGAPFQRDPTTSDLVDPRVGGTYKIGTVWPNEATGAIFMLANITGGNTANWVGITDAATGNVVGPASATDNAIARFDGTTGKLIQNSPVTMDDTTGTMTFPDGGGVVLTASGAAARKGTFTLTAGSSGVIATTSAVTGCVIAVTVTSLGTVTAASSFLVTINSGVGFTLTASQNTDTSTGTWAIVG